MLPAARPFIRASDMFTRRFSPHKDEKRAMDVLEGFEVAVAIGDDPAPMAEPEKLASDVKSGAKRVSELTG